MEKKNKSCFGGFKKTLRKIAKVLEKTEKYYREHPELMQSMENYLN